MTHDNHGRLTDVEIDALVLDAVGEMDDGSFDHLLEQALAEVMKTDESTVRTGSGGTSGKPRSSPRSTRWLLAAAAVVAVGSVAVLIGNRPPADDVAVGEVPTTAMDEPLSGPTSTAAPGPPSRCHLESGGGAVTPTDPSVPALSPRVFRCEIEVSVSEGDALVLMTDDTLIRGAIPAADVQGSPCIDTTSTSPSLVVVEGGCSGEGLSASSTTAGTYEIEFRLRTCADPATVSGCGPPESGPVGRIIVEVGT